MDFGNNGIFSIDNNGIDTHLIKNSEWAALAFFTQSKYGRGTIKIRNSIAENSKYSGQSTDVATIFSSSMVEQSTTGNAYGVYDTSSQVWDCTAAYIGSGNNIHITTLFDADSKYKNIYTPTDGQTVDYSSSESVYNMFENIKDAAIWEVSTNGTASSTAWFSGRSYIGSGENLLITRGGSKNGIDSIFAFGNATGTADTSNSRSFRPVLVVNNGL
ncbi:MAG: hypothetical protein Q4G09_06385 [Clostridia bacterium]|nr:hypothetical protein [Clostridia bacterium]